MNLLAASAVVVSLDAHASEKQAEERDSYMGQLVDAHRQDYVSVEKPLFDKSRRYYRNDFWGHLDPSSVAAASVSTMLASKNLVYAVTDTALSTMLGSNPQVSCDPRNQASEQMRYAVDGWLRYVFQAVRFRRRASQALMNAVLCKRGIFKTTWNRVEDRPNITVVDPSRLFFDLRATDVDDIRYWIEATVLSKREFNRRVECGLYRHKRIKDVQATAWPAWMESTDDASSRDMLRSVHQWVEVYEHYDRENGTFEHFVPGIGVVYRSPLPYIPYSMFSLVPSGVDCRGLSEVQLILSQQEAINDLLTLVKQVAYLMVPRMMFDSSAIDQKELAAALSAAPGAFVPVNPRNSMARRSLGAFFEQMPSPKTPSDVTDLIDRFEADAAHTTALAEMSRGQVVGARTATEMALIDAAGRNRLATRDGHLSTAIEDVASKVVWLGGRYLRSSKGVRVSGTPSWAYVDYKCLRDVEMDYALVAYNPLKSNPSVISETMQNIFPLLAQDPDINARELKVEMLRSMGLPVARIVKTKEEIQAETDAAMQAQGGGMPGGMPGAPAAPGGLPPGMDPAALLDAAGAAQEDGVVPAPEGAMPAPGAQEQVTETVQNMDMPPELVARLFGP